MYADHPLMKVALVKEPVAPTYIRTPKDTLDFSKDVLDLKQEAFFVFLVNAKNRLISRILITLGLVDTTMVHPREVFCPAIEQRASRIVLMHNHPSGDTTPSAEDIRITRQLVEAGKIINIEVMDSVIVGKMGVTESFNSLRENGIVSFA